MSLFKKIRGRKVLISMPIIPKSVIELTDEAQANVDADLMKKWSKLEVFAVGDLIEDIVAGDRVYVPSGYLQGAERVEIGDEVKFLVDDYQISIVW